jgi:ATP-binding cassette subfamily F protein uup
VSVLIAHHLHKSFGPRVVLDDVDIVIQPGERVGLVGVNGSGKSTLARILAGIEAADAGSVAVKRDAATAYLAQEPVFDGDPTAREAVLAGLQGWCAARDRYQRASAKLATAGPDVDRYLREQQQAEAELEVLGGWEQMHKVDAMLGHVGIARPDDRVRAMSGGERRRVALARTLVARPDLAILDEPTNHLDVDTVGWLETFLLEEYEGALLLITHDRYLLDRVAQRTLEIDRGKVFSYEGGYELYLEAKAARAELAARTEANRQNFLRRELEWLRRQPKARTTKQKARIERAEAAQAIAPPRVDRTVSLAIEEARSGKTILELHDVTVEMGGRVLVRNLDFHVTQGERVGVIGGNGAGKTTLLKVIAGQIRPARGSVVWGKNTRMVYFDQERGGLDDRLTVFENVMGDQAKVEIGGREIEPRAYLERFLFDAQRQRQPVGALSGGERARVALARMLRQPANLVLLDEPTNDLDVATLGALEELLTEFGGTTLVVTHDRWFLDRVATAILSFEGEGKVVRYAGNYETFRRLREEAQGSGASEPSTGHGRETSRPVAGPSRRQPGKARGLTYAERLELDRIVDDIAAAEEHVSKIEARLAEPAVYEAGGDEVKNLVGELDRAKAEVRRLNERWEMLESKREP